MTVMTLYFLWSSLSGEIPPALIRVRKPSGGEFASVLLRGGEWQVSEAADSAYVFGDTDVRQISAAEANAIEADYLAAQAAG